MHNCSNCKFALFDEKWGEYKCKKLELFVYNIEMMSDCSSYAKGKPAASKDLPKEK